VEDIIYLSVGLVPPACPDPGGAGGLGPGCQAMPSCPREAPHSQQPSPQGAAGPHGALRAFTYI